MANPNYKPAKQPELFPNETGYVGWFRVRGGRWTAVSQADTSAKAFKELLAYSDRLRARASDSMVLPLGKRP